MAEPVPAEQPPVDQDAPRTDGDSSQAALWSSPDAHAAPGNDGALRTGSTHEDVDQHEGLDDGLHAEVTQLRRAMETRPIIDQARGVLMATFGLTPQAAWGVLVATSQNTNTKLHRLASDLVETAQGGPLPKAVREQLAVAITKTNNAPPPEGSGA